MSGQSKMAGKKQNKKAIDRMSDDNGWISRITDLPETKNVPSQKECLHVMKTDAIFINPLIPDINNN